MATDIELLNAWRDGDRRAGNELFDRYFASIYGFFRNKAGDKAEDLAQQTFLGCVQSRDKFRQEASFRTYLFTIARSKLYDYLGKRHREGRFDGGVTSCEDLGLSPSRVVAKNQDHANLLVALRRLPVDFQVALELFYFENMRGPALAEVLGLPEGTVRSRLRRGRDALRQALEDVIGTPGGAETTMSNLEDWAEQIRELARATKS